MTIETLDISEARKQFNSLDKLLKAQDGHVIRVMRHGKEAFAVVDPEFLALMLETLDILANPEDARMLQESIRDIQEGRLIDHEQVKRELY